ncbi:hypothetical protein D3C75_1155870 [compost metagenome]
MIAEPAPKAATASRSLVINTRSLALALAPGPGVKVSTRPMIEDDGSAMVRAPVSTLVTVTPWKNPLIDKSPEIRRPRGAGP